MENIDYSAMPTSNPDYVDEYSQSREMYVEQLVAERPAERPTITRISFSGSQVDYVKFQVQHSLPISLSDGELTLIAYIFIHGHNAAEKFLEDKHSKSSASVGNYFTSLRKKGLLVDNELHPDLYLTSDPTGHVYTFNVV